MKIISYGELNKTLETILLQTGFGERDAQLCARIFSNSTVDGYHSHGINRFSGFVQTIADGYIDINGTPERLLTLGGFERWNGHLGPGPLNAHSSMGRAIHLAKQYGMGCVALQNTSHWMRGGTYGWQAAENGCIGICFTNTEPNMPSWGAREANTGNNPLIVAVPRDDGHLVLDMSLSQFSYGKMQQLSMEGKELPFHGGFNSQGELTSDPKAIVDSGRLLPAGYWKGSGLSIMLDLVATLLSSGKSTSQIGKMEVESGISQVFICFDTTQLNEIDRHKALVNEIIDYVMKAEPLTKEGSIDYPGSRTLKRRKKHMKEGIPVNEDVWRDILAMID